MRNSAVVGGFLLVGLLELVLAAGATAQTPPPGTPAALLRAAKTWGYQLNQLEPDRLAGTNTDVLIIDYSRDGSAANELKSADLERLKRKPDGTRRLVLAYLSIGEAESYRYYWTTWWSDLWVIPNPFGPKWRGKLNPDWGGNYAVRYWDPGWQAILLGETGKPGYLDRILAAGFDGVWLDKVDSAIEDIAAKNPNAKADMITLVGRIADKGRRARPGFLVVPQNGEELLPDAGYRAIIDGLGKEDLLYNEDAPGKANKPETVARRTALLKQLTAEGKPVLAVEYVTDEPHAGRAKQDLATLGLVPLIALRDLDKLPGDLSSAFAAGPARKARVGDGRGDPRPIWAGLGAVALLLGWLLARRRRS